MYHHLNGDGAYIFHVRKTVILANIFTENRKKTAASLGWQWNKKSLFNYSVGFVLHLVGTLDENIDKSIETSTINWIEREQKKMLYASDFNR